MGCKMKFTLQNKNEIANTDKQVLHIKKVVVPDEGLFVNNVIGTSDESPPQGYNSAIEYWRSRASGDMKECPAIDPHKKEDGSCVDTKDIVGAHVRIYGEECPEDEAWVVPLCKHCNSADRDWSIYLPAGTCLIPVRLSKKYKTAKSDMDYWVVMYTKLFCNGCN